MQKIEKEKVSDKPLKMQRKHRFAKINENPKFNQVFKVLINTDEKQKNQEVKS